MGRRQVVCVWLLLVILVLAWAVNTSAQNTASLAGTVLDPHGQAIRGAKVTLTSRTTGAARDTTGDEVGLSVFVSPARGKYKIGGEGGANLGFYPNDQVNVRGGKNATFDPRMERKGAQQTVTETPETANIKTKKKEVPDTFDSRRI